MSETVSCLDLKFIYRNHSSIAYVFPEALQSVLGFFFKSLLVQYASKCKIRETHPIAVAEHSSTACVLPGPKTNVSFRSCVSGLPRMWASAAAALPVQGAWFTGADTLLGGNFLIWRVKRILCSSLQLGERAARFDSWSLPGDFTPLFWCQINPRAADVLLNVWQNVCYVHSQGYSSNGSSVISLAVYLCCEN